MQSDTTRAKWGTLISCSLSCFIGWLDFAIVNTALPAIAKDLSASLIQLQWVINAFILALAVTIVTLGRISDLYGRRLVNIIGVSLFGLSSLCAGLAASPEWLVFFRMLQGVANAAIIPSAMALIFHAFPANERGKAIGIWSAFVSLGMALGPVVGGIFVSALSWRWIFYINVPISLISVIVSLLFARESRSEEGSRRIDWKGVCLMTMGLVFLVGGLMHAPDWGWENIKTWGSLGVAVIALLWFYRSEIKSTSPTIPFALFANRGFLYSTMVIVCLMFVFTAAIFLMPQYLMNIRHEEPYIAGLMLLPITVCIALFSPFVGRMVDKFSVKILMLIGLILYLGSTVMQIGFAIATSPYFILLSFALMGLGFAFARNSGTTKALASAPHHLAGTAAGVLWTAQNTGGALSIAITVTLFRTIYESTSTPASFLVGYHSAMWLLSAVILATILILLFAFKK
jgi:EmrB/QacA subfamily drug resistance transporter